MSPACTRASIHRRIHVCLQTVGKNDLYTSKWQQVRKHFIKYVRSLKTCQRYCFLSAFNLCLGVSTLPTQEQWPSPLSTVTRSISQEGGGKSCCNSTTLKDSSEMIGLYFRTTDLTEMLCINFNGVCMCID